MSNVGYSVKTATPRKKPEAIAITELHPVEQTEKESPRELAGQAPMFERCLSCFQLYPLVVVKVNVFSNQLVSFFESGFLEVA